MPPSLTLPATLHTERLLLRRWRPGDETILRSAVDASDSHLRRWIPWMKDEPRSMDETAVRIAHQIGEFDAGVTFCWAVFHDGTFVGEVMLMTRAGPGALEVGYWLHADHAGRGYGRESVSRLVALADELGLEAGGDLGVMTVESAPTLLVQAAESLKRGEHSAVLRSPLGYHVFLLVARTMGGTVPDDEARASVEGWLLDEAVESRLRLWLAATTDELGLSVDEDVLARVRCCRDGRPYLAPEESS